MNCLVFQLYGPLAAWGDIAVGERRRTWGHPSRSAVLGLVAAALGIPRTAGEALVALHRGYGFACRTAGSNRLLVDYHTTQTAPRTLFKKKVAYSRPDAIHRDPGKLQTILSQREYLTDAYAVACLWAHPGAPQPLEVLAQALQNPTYTLYLGRKSCPLALPLHPTIVEDVANPVAALTSVRFPGESEILRRLSDPRHPSPERVFWEGDFDDLSPMETRRRRDVAGDRATWTFSERLEHAAVLEPSDVSQSH
jgi:CRISPR system Cascade subunit CasD